MVVPALAHLTRTTGSSAIDEPALLAHIEALMVGGLATAWKTRAYTSEEVNAVTGRLQALEPEDLEGRLVVAGFTERPYVAPDDVDAIEQACATCMYFERHRGWCNLAELMLPVKPEWSCILWRI
ncbi:MAG: hypothetical protein Q7U99_12095 [Rubrivivax sp.]|nr:hypothetical protein [Rubrivivax sp.]MDP3224825.1 hypothetical protein [Rubrivivax sp.]